MELNHQACYRALLARDRRYDGVFFTAVKTTGVYCRPICPARPPRPENCIFLGSAAAAQEAGFRPCLRCRPESSPDLGAWKGTSATVSRALKLIEAGALDSGDASALAERLGMGERQLRHLFRRHLGASPISVAQTRRVLLAKQLLVETRLSITEVALASGFASVRRFNETIQRLYGRAPSALRGTVAKCDPLPAGELNLMLPYKAPYDWEAMLADLSKRSQPGLDAVAAGNYRRQFWIDGRMVWIEARNQPAASALRLSLSNLALSLLPRIIARVRRVFDLAADPIAIATALREDPLLADLVERRPGLRLVGSWDSADDDAGGQQGQSLDDLGASLGRLLERAVGDEEAASRLETWRPWEAYARHHIALADGGRTTIGNADAIVA
jgi:AraC family transcriptional regulator, regulatory protein of adaptative response / DNA-3-methyladenine glycosylase II